MTATLPLRLFAIICAAIGVVPLANLLTDGRAVVWWGAAVREWTVRGVAVLALAALMALLLGARVDATVDAAKRNLLRIPSRAFAIAAAIAAFAAAALLAHFCFAGQPFTSDEMAQQWHARILLSGRLSAHPEPLREFFNTWPVYDRDDRWFSQYPIGMPALIAAGLFLRAAWLVNPLFLAFATWSLYRFLALAFDELTARITTLLFVLSPMVLIVSASQMNHAPALAFATLALAALARWDGAENPRIRRRQAIVTGLALGLMTLVRPLDAAVVILIVACFQAWRALGARERWSSLAVQLLAGSIPVALLLWANARTTGSPLLFGYEALNGPEHGIGFHVDPNGQMHTPRRGLVIVSSYVMHLSRHLWEWPLPGVLFLVAGLAAVRRPSRWDVLLAVLAMGITAAYGAYWFEGLFSGPRFLFTALPAFVYFTARAPALVAASVNSPVLRRATMLVVPLCVLATWLGPKGVSSARARVLSFHDQRTKQKTDVAAQVERAGLHDALVFVNEDWRGRLLARLRALDMSQFRAEQIMGTVDACALQSALDAEDSLMARGTDERRARVVRRARAFGEAKPVPGLSTDQVVAIVPGSRPTAECLREPARDTSGTMPYGVFLARQTVGADGRIAGDVVFARDMGDRNELLRGRFGGRSWYRYRVGRSVNDTASGFVSYRRERSAPSK